MVSGYCNVRVYRLTRREGVEVKRELVARSHNAVLTSGVDQVRDALRNGSAWQLAAIGLGSDGTAVSASQTWGLTPLLVSAPTSSYCSGPMYRATLLIEEGDLVGDTIREVWIAPATSGVDAYARVVISEIAKTDDYAYLFLFDCSWGGACTRLAWNMIAALAASGGAYTYQLKQCVAGRGTAAESVDDVGLADPWTMTPIDVSSSSVSAGLLRLNFTVEPDRYNGETMAEVGLYYVCTSGSSPVPSPGLYARNLLAEPRPIEVGVGGQIAFLETFQDGG